MGTCMGRPRPAGPISGTAPTPAGRSLVYPSAGAAKPNSPTLPARAEPYWQPNYTPHGLRGGEKRPLALSDRSVWRFPKWNPVRARERTGILAYGVGLTLFAWYLLLIRGGLRSGFSADDLMNLHYYWSRSWTALFKANLFFWSSYYRPAGGLYYRPIYALWGLTPLPFHAAALVLLSLNFGLWPWWFANSRHRAGPL